MTRKFEYERADYTTQRNALLARVAALKLEIHEREERISRLQYQQSPEAAQWDIPPAYSAQLADLQAQVWELRQEVVSRTARVAELEQQCCLGTSERALYERLRLTLASREEALKRMQHHQQGCASVVSAAVAALRREYPDVFLRCTEIARQRYPRAEGAAADYYTLGVYGYRTQAQSPQSVQEQRDEDIAAADTSVAGPTMVDLTEG
jgi:chromosome segregation ATPase